MPQWHAESGIAEPYRVLPQDETNEESPTCPPLDVAAVGLKDRGLVHVEEIPMAVPAAESAHESEPNGTANSHISEPVKELRPLIPLQSEEQYQALPAGLTAENANPTPLPPPDLHISLDADGLHLPPISKIRDDASTTSADVFLPNPASMTIALPDPKENDCTTDRTRAAHNHDSFMSMTSAYGDTPFNGPGLEGYQGWEVGRRSLAAYSNDDCEHGAATIPLRDQQYVKDFELFPSKLQETAVDGGPGSNRTCHHLPKDFNRAHENGVGNAVVDPEQSCSSGIEQCHRNFNVINNSHSDGHVSGMEVASKQPSRFRPDSSTQLFNRSALNGSVVSNDLPRSQLEHSEFPPDGSFTVLATSIDTLHCFQPSVQGLGTEPHVTTQLQSLQPNPPPPIQVEDNWTDADSAYNDETQSLTTSLKSSVTKYEYENGRRYHADDGSSWHFLPNDAEEMDRLDLFHHIMHLRCDERLHLAPINPYPQRILDLGTGTGIWAVLMGELYESASVLGNDLSPIQPTLVPPNVSFEVDDMEKEWCYSSSFDYIHCRYMAGAIRDWPKLMRQAYEYTKPGGWVEFKDFTMQFYSSDGSYERSACECEDQSPIPSPSPDRWTREIIAGIRSLGLEPEPGPKLESWIKDAGFVNVIHHLLPIPVGDWPKDKKLKRIGRADMTQFLDGLDAISLRVFTTTRGWRPEEVQILLADVRRTLQNRNIHAQHDFHVVYGQRPWNS